MPKFYNYLSSERRSARNSGLNISYWLSHRSLARGVKRNPHLPINEWIAANLGWFLRLPIPPFALRRKGGSPRFFGSLDYGKPESEPADMDPEILAHAMPRESTGVVLFDVLIANPDRHEENLKVDSRANPTQIEVFDHDCALLGHNENCGVYRLRNVISCLGLTKGLQDSPQYHKLGKAIGTDRFFYEWYQRIGSIPDAFINEICDETRQFDASSEQADLAAKFLMHRCQTLPIIIKENRKFFASIKSWEIF